jgi:hypothetical protein
LKNQTVPLEDGVEEPDGAERVVGLSGGWI